MEKSIRTEISNSIKLRKTVNGTNTWDITVSKNDGETWDDVLSQISSINNKLKRKYEN